VNYPFNNSQTLTEANGMQFDVFLNLQTSNTLLYTIHQYNEMNCDWSKDIALHVF